MMIYLTIVYCSITTCSQVTLTGESMMACTTQGIVIASQWIRENKGDGYYVKKWSCSSRPTSET